jgi:hypothetical protein
MPSGILHCNAVIGCSSDSKGRPSISRLEPFPPRIEVPENSGIYVLVDDGPLEAWKYQFVATIDD